MATFMITVDSASGVDINGTIDSFNGGFSPNPITGTGNAGRFVPDSDPLTANKYVEYGIQPPSGSGANNALVAEGDFTYTTGTLTGTLDQISIGTDLRDSGTSVPSPSASFSGTDLDLASKAFTISGLDLSTNLNSTLFDFLQGNETLLENYVFNNASNNIVFTGGAGGDSIVASIGNDVLNGLGGADVLNGAAGADTINGGAGADTLTGGTGNDTFVFSSSAHSSVGAFDTIIDLVAGGDKIDVSALNLSGGFSASGPAVDSIWYDATAHKLFADVSGSPAADFAVAVTALTGTLSASDFVV